MINRRSTRYEWGGIASQRWEQPSSAIRLSIKNQWSTSSNLVIVTSKRWGYQMEPQTAGPERDHFRVNFEINICFGVLALNIILTSQHNPWFHTRQVRQVPILGFTNWKICLATLRFPYSPQAFSPASLQTMPGPMVTTMSPARLPPQAFSHLNHYTVPRFPAQTTVVSPAHRTVVWTVQR